MNAGRAQSFKRGFDLAGALVLLLLLALPMLGVVLLVRLW